VGRKLNRWAAAAGWHVLHAVPIGTRGTDIDHVVIGPFGLVTVNTKTTSTSVWVGEFGGPARGSARHGHRARHSHRDRGEHERPGQSSPGGTESRAAPIALARARADSAVSSTATRADGP
jgi:hypothetical protein